MTGAFDRAIRVWDADKPQQPLAVVVEHSSHVNALCFDALGRRLFAGDADGILKARALLQPLSAAGRVPR